MGLLFTARMTSPGCRPAFAAGPSFSTELTKAPRGRSSPKDSASCAFTSWMVTPMRPRTTLPVFTVACHVDRNCERHAHVAARAAENLRVDADHLAGQVEQRTAGVTRIDG